MSSYWQILKNYNILKESRNTSSLILWAFQNRKKFVVNPITMTDFCIFISNRILYIHFLSIHVFTVIVIIYVLFFAFHLT